MSQDTLTRSVGADAAGTGTTADDLRAARAIYEANPSHDRYCPADGTVCPIWALSDAHATGEAWALLLAAAGSPDSIAEWNADNDTPTVLAAFDKAITLAEATDVHGEHRGWWFA